MVKKFFNKHYLFSLTYVFAIVFCVLGAFGAKETSRLAILLSYGLIFIPMFFFFRYSALDLKLFNLYMLLGFILGFLCSSAANADLKTLTVWGTAGIPFVIAFDLICIKTGRATGKVGG